MGTKLIVTYHPAYLLRDPRQKAEAWKDLQLAMKFLQSAAAEARRELGMPLDMPLFDGRQLSVGEKMAQHTQLQAADGHKFDAYIAQPTGEPKAGIVVVQEIFGVNAHIRSVADRFAQVRDIWSSLPRSSTALSATSSSAMTRTE